MVLIADRYGKARVRIMRVHRDGAHNTVRELSVSVMLTGHFARAYTDADNTGVVATDTIKNIVNIVARENVAAASEPFCVALAQRFLDRYAQIAIVHVATQEILWTRMDIGGVPHPHGFQLNPNGRPTVQLEQRRDCAASMRSGIEDFTFMKTTGSGWSSYLIDDYTTLRETQDRIAATSMQANWLWSDLPADPDAANATILRVMLEVFANTYSQGMQDSLGRMGEAALAAIPQVAEINLACPNKHYVPIDLTRFGLSADNLVFTPTDEPHGQIECTIGR